MKIKAYLKPHCGWSNGVRAIMRKYSLEYEDIDVINNRANYEEMVRKSVLAHGKILAGPSSWANRPGYMLLQGRKGATTTGYKPQ